MKPIRTLVLIANESAARLFVNEGVGKGLAELKSISADDYEKIDTRYSDAPGRSATPGGGGHVFDRPTSERTQTREKFARHVREVTDKAWSSGDFQRFVRVAPPKMLGALRAIMNGPVTDNLVLDMDKDLVKTPILDLPAHFEDQTAF